MQLIRVCVQKSVAAPQLNSPILTPCGMAAAGLAVWCCMSVWLDFTWRLALTCQHVYNLESGGMYL